MKTLPDTRSSSLGTVCVFGKGHHPAAAPCSFIDYGLTKNYPLLALVWSDKKPVHADAKHYFVRRKRDRETVWLTEVANSDPRWDTLRDKFGDDIIGVAACEFAGPVDLPKEPQAVAAPPPKPVCCYILPSDGQSHPCGKPAVWEIRPAGPVTLDDYTHACVEHVGDLLTDATQQLITRL